MTLLDWLILFVPITAVVIVALYTAKYNKSVADFLVAGRCAGRYLLATASGEAGSAAVTAIALFQMTSKTGFAFQFWAPLYSTVPILLATIGWVSYRFRETRVLSAGQFFEVRYTKRFRLFMGGLSFLSQVLSYGITPAISSQFFVYYLQLPETLDLFGLAFPTWQFLALGYLSFSLYFALSGGTISILICECLEGMFSQIAYVIIIITLLLLFGWHNMAYTLTHRPAHQSMVNPFDMGKTQDFNIYFILISLVHAVLAAGAGGSSAKNPHEQRMAGILGHWRGFAFALMRTILAICAMTFLMNPHFTDAASSAHSQLTHMSQTVRDPMTVPVAASNFLPFGIKGLFCAIMLMGVLAGDANGLLGKSAIFVQDVVLPIRNMLKLPSMSRDQHISYLRCGAIAVAVFAYTFSSLFKQTQYIQLYWQATGAVYGGGAGAVLIGGLYWKKGTPTAAWITMLVGAFCALTGIILQQLGVTFIIGGQNLLHGQYVSIITLLVAYTTYISVSFLTYRQAFNMDRMLHRGEYAVAGEKKKVAPPIWKRFNPAKIIGIDEEYTFWDRVIAYGIFGWVWCLFGVSMVGVVWNFIHPWTTENWVTYWFIFGLCIPFVASIGTTIWFTIGGIYEIRAFIRSLLHEKRDDRDDGTVGPGHPA